MTVYKYFVRIALKNKWPILSYILIFLLISLINNSSVPQEDGVFMEARLNLGIVDQCNSKLSKSLHEYLRENNNVVAIEYNEDYIKEQIFLEIVDAVVIIPKNFDEKVIKKENILSYIEILER